MKVPPATAALLMLALSPALAGWHTGVFSNSKCAPEPDVGYTSVSTAQLSSEEFTCRFLNPTKIGRHEAWSVYASCLDHGVPADIESAIIMNTETGIALYVAKELIELRRCE